MKNEFRETSPNLKGSVPTIATKRVFDLVVSFSALVLLSPFILIISIALFLENLVQGHPFWPILYSETRMSQGRPFRLRKFFIFKHSVIEEMRANGEFIHTKPLERNGSLTFVGKILKQIYMDELPQLWNVIEGDLSLVGPRPVNTEVYRRLMNEGITAKAFIKAGITGIFQSLKNERGKRSATLDQEYLDICRRSPWWQIIPNDIRIIFRTLKVILKAKGI